MGALTEIAWTDHTFNIVWGCEKVSDACKFCYAEGWAKRTGWNVWGKNAPRRTFGDKHWSEPLKWNAKAEREGRRHRVFCSSMADVFEDHPTVAEERKKLWPLIEATPWLDWQLLTKRPENIKDMLPQAWSKLAWPNVWLGVTAENQEMADKRIPLLLEVPAVVRFVSAEPLLGPLNLAPYLGLPPVLVTNGVSAEMRKALADALRDAQPLVRLGPGEMVEFVRGAHPDWVIVGGESGAHARPFALDWARDIVAQCRAAGVAPFVKQLGDNALAPADGETGAPRELVPLRLIKAKGGDIAEFPADLQVRDFPIARAA
jgi:protein gp37